MQINSGLGLTIEGVLGTEPAVVCTNLAVEAAVLTAAYGLAVARYGEGQAALSAYNTGNFITACRGSPVKYGTLSLVRALPYPNRATSSRIGIMALGSFAVSPVPGITGEVEIVARYNGRQRIAAYVPREAIDDYFSQHQLTDDERMELVNSNLHVFRPIIASKFEDGLYKPFARYGSRALRIDITLADLQQAPPMSDEYLKR